MGTLGRPRSHYPKLLLRRISAGPRSDGSSPNPQSLLRPPSLGGGPSFWVIWSASA